MTTLGDIRTALADQLSAALPGVNCYRIPVDSISPPALIVAGFRSDDTATMDGHQHWSVDIFAAVSRRNVDFIDDLDEMVSNEGDRSAWAALDADPTLGGVVAWSNVISVGSYDEISLADVAYYAATISVEVMF
jgi:hypothetical protein